MSAQAGTWTIRQGRKHAKIARVARVVLVVSGVLAALLGPLVMVGKPQVLPVHELLGDVAVLSLWTLATVGGLAGVSAGKVALAAGLGVVELVLAGTQKGAFGPTGHAITQVLHVASSIGVVAGGLLLARSVLRREVAPEAVSQPTLAEAAAEFLGKRRIAVTGVSRKPDSGHGANVVYRRLRERGYEVFAVNPNAEVVEGDRAYGDLRAIAGGVEAVVIATRPERAIGTVRECAELGVQHVWMHRGVGGTSVSREATEWGRAHGLRVIDGGCPLMFKPAADAGHKAMRGLLTLTGKVPRRVPERNTPGASI
jgi:predicted CoA-binding protein